MSRLPQDKPSTADFAAAGEAAPPPEEPREEMSSNVRRLERVPRSDDGQPDADRPAALLPGTETTEFRHRWDRIQTGFVDEPRRAVEEADSLVAQTMKRLAEVFAEERAGLERQWSQGQDVSTEDLRVALKRYRSFFDRLLSV